MSTRKECENAYRIIGKPKDIGHLRLLFDQAAQTYTANHKKCLKDIDRHSNIHSYLTGECNDVLEQDVSKLRLASDFLKQHHSLCNLGIKCADSYMLLGLRDGNEKKIKEQYKLLSRKYHPDSCKEEMCRDKQNELNAAKKFLSDSQNGCIELEGLQHFIDVHTFGSSLGQNEDL